MRSTKQRAALCARRTRALVRGPVDVTGSRVLIIDDNEVNRAILSEQMESWTFDACAAAVEGVQVFQELTQAIGEGQLVIALGKGIHAVPAGSIESLRFMRS